MDTEKPLSTNQESTQVSIDPDVPVIPEPPELYLYEAQHFGFRPTSLINGMFNTICDLYRDALKAFANAMADKFPSLMTEEELLSARHRVAVKIDRDISTVFDLLEHYLLANIFTVPESVVLQEDVRQLDRFSSEEQNELQKKRDDTIKKIIAYKLANAKLSAHLKAASTLQASLDEIINKFSSHDQLNAEQVTDIISFGKEMLMRQEDH